MTFKEKLNNYPKNQLIEIITIDDRELTGFILEVGDDFLTISHSTDRETSKIEGGKSVVFKEVFKLETSISFSKISHVTKVVNKVTK